MRRTRLTISDRKQTTPEDGMKKTNAANGVKTKVFATIALLGFCYQAIAQDSPHIETIRKGVQLHDRWSYDAAIAVYKSVLADHPDDALALYELAFTYQTIKNYAACE